MEKVLKEMREAIWQLRISQAAVKAPVPSQGLEVALPPSPLPAVVSTPPTTGAWMLLEGGGKGKEETIVLVMRGALSLGILGGGQGGGGCQVQEERDVGSAAG
ncbi:hypothetical protein BDZ91DRAFT_803699 [Kalaharituber pfeilii]|nr:hypothetical protein BDZ91DRAFT_803699 [Kalaharituber pfeilii]